MDPRLANWLRARHYHYAVLHEAEQEGISFSQNVLASARNTCDAEK